MEDIVSRENAVYKYSVYGRSSLFTWRTNIRSIDGRLLILNLLGIVYHIGRGGT